MMSVPPQLPSPGVVLRRLLQNLGGGLRDLVLLPFLSRIPREWVVLRLDRGLAEASTPSPWLEQLMQRPPLLANVLEVMRYAQRDEQVQGVLLKLGPGSLGWAKVSALARALGRLREAGKRVVAYAENTGNAGAWLGAMADHFWMAPEGRLDLLGVRMEVPFLRRALEKLQIEPDVISAGRYKSAAETLERSSMSRAAREALEAVVERLYEALIDGLASGSAGSAERAREWIDNGPYLAVQAQEIGLVDELVYADEVPQRLAALAPGNGEPEAGHEARLVSAASYARVARPRFQWQPVLGEANELAVVVLQGLILPGAGSSRGIVGLLGRLAQSDNVRAVVLRIDSPGGDPLASDLIWRAVGKLAEKKPVVASLGDTGASGGYYVAMAANEIIAEPTTLTGSIGVVMASLKFDAFLEQLGVSFDAVERGRHAGIYDPVRARTEEERALLRRQIELLYTDFVRKAAKDRGLSEEVLDRVAQGRVWTGSHAKEHALVDQLGGLDVALARVRELSGLEPEAGRVVQYAVSPVAARFLRSSPLERARGAQFLCPVQVRLD